MQLQGLEEGLNFGDDELAANRAGTLAPTQSGRLLGSGLWRFLVGPPVIVAGVVIALFVDSVWYAILALIGTGIGLYITWRGFAFVVDSWEGDVAYITARLKLRAETSRGITSYYAEVGPVTKHISKSAYEALRDGDMLNLYYAPGCRSLLSVEPVSAEEPKPAHPFGPDTAHSWDRLRWSWVFMTIGLIGIGVGVHQVFVAHPARAVAVEGKVTDYYESRGSRTIYMDNGNKYSPQDESAYTPPAPAWGSLIGDEVTLYVSADTGEVLAVNAGGTLHAGDWYLHPDNQKSFELTNGAFTAGLAFLLGFSGLLQVLRSGRRVPPTVRKSGLLSGALATSVALLLVGGIVAIFVSQH